MINDAEEQLKGGAFPKDYHIEYYAIILEGKLILFRFVVTHIPQ